jgi:ankyrin repeat protein
MNSNTTFGQAWIAASNGRVDSIKAMIAASPELLHHTSERGWSLIHVVAEFCQPEVCAYLLQHMMPFSSSDVDGFTPLHLAANNRCELVAAQLLAAGADPNALTHDQMTPLHLAATSLGPVSGMRPIANLLLRKGATLDLNCAVALGRVESVRNILTRNPDEINTCRRPDLLCRDAVVTNHAVQIISLLLNAGIDVDRLGPDNRTALHEAASDRKQAVVRLLLGAKANPEARALQGETPLWLAITSTRRTAPTVLVRTLLRGGARLDLNSAIQLRRVDEAISMLATSQSIDSLALFPSELLCDAIRFTRYPDLVSAILDRGVDANHPNREGMLPLICAIYTRADLALLLLDRGARRDVTTVTGQSAIDLVRERIRDGAIDYQEVLKRLEA